MFDGLGFVELRDGELECLFGEFDWLCLEDGQLCLDGVYLHGQFRSQ